MSLQEWKLKFYPRPASLVYVNDAINHSLTKWRGLRPEQLKKFNITVSSGILQDELCNIFQIDYKTCALCEYYYHNFTCDCPLAITRKGTPCDKRLPDEIYSPYYRFIKNDDPELMIKWLEKAKRKFRNQPYKRNRRK
jgi:hypothetical protein